MPCGLVRPDRPAAKAGAQLRSESTTRKMAPQERFSVTFVIRGIGGTSDRIEGFVDRPDEKHQLRPGSGVLTDMRGYDFGGEIENGGWPVKQFP